VDQYIAAFEKADIPALAALLRHDVELEMPPIPTWFAGRSAVVDFFATRVLLSAGGRRVVGTRANGCPAVATYSCGDSGTYAAHSVQVLETDDGRITHIYAFLDTELFGAFNLPLMLS
jgi:RNA polymerase sigma-70 factor (ECF subfamily)